MKEGGMNQAKEMTFIEHLEELRWHLFRSVVVIFSISVLAFIFKHIVFDVIVLGPVQKDFVTNRLFCLLGEKLNNPALCINNVPLKIVNLTVAGQFTTHIRISFIMGFLFSFPYVMYEVWRFVKPALYIKEKTVAGRSVLAINVLFYLGVALGYFIMTPLAINFLANYSISSNVENNINISSYISNLSTNCFATGIVFELPVLVYFLSTIGILTPHFMKNYRKHAILVILIIAGIITPGPDVFSQMLVATPLYLLYEISIHISARVLRKKSKNDD